jgi:hypothetical protein
MDFSDIVQTPEQEPPAQPPVVQKKPYWQVLDEYDKASATEPELAKLSVPEFSQKMNEAAGTQEYDEGLNSGLIRKAGGAIERGLRHFGGVLPGEKRLFGLKTPSEMLGGPETGFDVPAAAKELGKSVATASGASPELAEKIGGATEGLPKTGLTVAIGAGLGGIPAIAGLSGLETYGETGRVIPAAISAGTAALFPKLAEVGGQSALRMLGAKTVGEIKPELAALLDKTLPSTAETLAKRAPALGWGPAALTQRAGRVGGAQVGMLGAGITGETAQTALDPNLSWQDKLKAIGEEFSPSSLAASAVAQLPFTAFDVFNERTHPLTQLERQTKAAFAERYKAQALKGDPESGSPPFVPSVDEINKVIQGLTTGKIEPSSKEATVLKSMGNLPVVPDLKTPVITSEEAVPMPEAMEATKERTTGMLIVQGFPREDVKVPDQMVYQALRAVEAKYGGKGSKEDTYYHASNIVANRIMGDQRTLDTLGKGPDLPTRADLAEQNRQKRLQEIADAVNPDSPSYDKEAHQRIALATGDPEHWIKAGITDPILYNAEGELVEATSKLGEGPEIDIARRNKQTRALDRNIVDRFTGMRPKPTLDPDIVSRQKEGFAIDSEVRELLKSEMPTPEQQERLTALQGRRDVLDEEIRKLQIEQANITRTRSFTKVGQPMEVQSAIWAEATERAVERAFDYGKQQGDIGKNSLDLKDPASVTKFINHVIGAMKRGEIDALRARTKRAAERTLPERYKDQATAEAEADRLSLAAQASPGDQVLSYRAAQKRGEWRVVEQIQPRLVAFSSTPLSDDIKAQITHDVLEQAGEEQKPVTLEGMGVDMGTLKDNVFLEGRDRIAKQETDPAKAAARMEALAQNAIYYINNLSIPEFKRIILGHAEEKYGKAKSGVRDVLLKKQQMIKYIQFLRDKGEVDLTVKATAPEAKKTEVVIRGREGETVVPAVRTEEGVEVGWDAWMDRQGMTKVYGERLVAEDTEQRRTLNEYMGKYSPVGRYEAPHERAGQPRLDDYNKGVVSNLNFFEQFGALMADFRKKLPDPRQFADAPEARPLSDFGGVPPGFRDTVINNLLVRWGPGFPEKGGLRAPGGVFEPTYPSPGKPVKVMFYDRQGNEVGFKKDQNPLRTFFTESAKRELVMPLNKLLDLFEQHGQLDESGRQMLALARKLGNNSSFIRDMPVGSSIAVDPTDHGYFHTDTVASSAGLLISPFKAVDPTYMGGKYIRELMTPNEIFPHLMNEVGHATADFAYLKDTNFRNEIDQIFNYVNEHVTYLQTATGGLNEWSHNSLHSLSDPREFLAGIFNDQRLHQLLSSIKDPFSPLPGARPVGAVDNLFVRIKTAISHMLANLFGIRGEDANTLLDRMSQLAATGFEIQQKMNLTHRGDVYHEMIRKGYIEGEKAPPRGVIETPPPKGPAWRQITGEGMVIPPFTPEPFETVAAPRAYPSESVTRRLPAPPIYRVIRNHEARLAEAQAKLAMWAQHDPVEAQAAQATIAQEETALRSLRAMQTGKIPILKRGETAEEYALRKERERTRVAYPQPEAPGKRVETPEAWAVTPEGQVLKGPYVAPAPKTGEGQVLKSRLVPDEDTTEIPRPIFNIAGRKGTLLRDPVVNNIVTSFTAGQNVKDAFSGSGQLSTFAKNAGASRVDLNVFRPEMHSIFNEIKTNPYGFSRRVANVARLIDARRGETPRMRDGSDLKAYLDGVQARDPNVGLFLKQNFNFFGREVGVEGAFTPYSMITNKGLSELPQRIQLFSKSVDAITNDDGWNVVANAQPGERVMVDPPYIAERTRYGTGAVSPEQRIADYEKHLYPAAERGANFLVFDIADPQLMQSLADHGFTVQPVQRTSRAGGATKQEFVAYNHAGEVLQSRADPHAVLDSMKSAALYLHEDNDRIWFRPFDGNYFRDTYGPAFGYNLRWEPRGDETGYSVSKAALNGLTQQDLSLMPKPIVKQWAPSLFETLSSMYREQGSSQETANAIASQMLQFGALLKDTDRAIWGRIPVKDAEAKTLAMAWGWQRIAGITPEAMTARKPVDYTVRHESAHLAGLHSNVEGEAPDVRAAYKQVTDVFSSLDETGRKAFLEGLGSVTTADGNYPGFYQKAVMNPVEFAAEFMGHVGDVITNVPKPSAYLKDEMRFVPDELSRLLIKSTLRRTQGVTRLVNLVEDAARQRGIADKDWYSLVETTAKAFEPLARSALDIANDQAEFYRTRNLYPDMYRGLLKDMAQRLEEFQAYQTHEERPSLPGEILKSKGGLVSDIRNFLNLPDPANLPKKLGFWDRQLTQFGQFADKYPQARSAWDMFAAANAMFNGFKIKMHTALAGAFEGGKPSSDARTKDVHKFTYSPSLRAAFDKIALDLNFFGDFMYKQELGAVGGDVMKMNPQAVTGWLTPEYINSLLTKYGVKDADKPTMRTVLDGTRNQITVASSIIVESARHKMDTAIAAAVARNTDLPPEGSRKTAKLLSDAVQMQGTDINGAMAKLAEFQQAVPKPEAFERMFDMANSTWENIQTLERFLSLRQPYYMSERRPGQYGLFFKDKADKITSRYFKNSSERDKYIAANKIDPVRQTNPGERDYGVSPAIFKELDESYTRMKEKLVNVFGEKDAESLAAAMDIGTELRDALNSRDILKVTTGRDLAPGREELDMFAAHQQYINAISRAAYNNFVRLEAELVNSDPVLSNQPMIKDYINRQVKQVLVQDSPLGRQMQNLGFLYYLWGNVSSMMLQAMDQFSGLAPMITSRGGSIAGSYSTIAKANKMLIESRFGGKYKDPEIQAALERARADGILGSWIARELDIGQDLPVVNRMRATTGKSLWTPFEMLKNRTYQGYAMMRRLYDTIPKYNAEVGFVAALLHLRSPAGGSMSGEALYKEAQFLKELAMYPGGKTGRPGFFQHVPRSAAQSLWSLQTYANGLTTMLGELVRRSFNPKGVTPAQATQARKAAAQALITQTAVAGVLGLPFAQGIVYALQKMFPEHNIEQDVRDMLAGLFGDDEQMGQAFSSAMAIGIPSAMDYAPDLGSRFALSGTFHVSPYSGVDWTSLVGPSGGILSNVFQGAQAGLRGDPIKGIKSIMPVGAQRIWKSLEEGQTHKTGTGRIVVDDLRPEEIVARMIGFRPARVHRIEEFERLSRVSQDAEKAEQTRWTREQVGLLKTGRDADVQRNVAQRVAETKGLYPAVQLSNDISREYERETMPVNLRSFGNRATILAQKSLRGVLGTQDEGPGNLERLQLQQTIASRLGLGGPSRGSLRHAASVDQLLSMYPHLTNAQANLLLTHAAASRPSPELYSELLGTPE